MRASASIYEGNVSRTLRDVPPFPILEFCGGSYGILDLNFLVLKHMALSNN